MGANWGSQKVERERDCRIEIDGYRRERRGGQNRNYKRDKQNTRQQEKLREKSRLGIKTKARGERLTVTEVRR